MHLEMDTAGFPRAVFGFLPSQNLQPLTLVSCTPELLLSVRDAKTNETDSSLAPEAPTKEAGPARRHTSAPDLRHSSLLGCPGLELGNPLSRNKEVKSASAMNIFTSTEVSRVLHLPRGLCSGGGGRRSLAFWSLLYP